MKENNNLNELDEENMTLNLYLDSIIKFKRDIIDSYLDATLRRCKKIEETPEHVKILRKVFRNQDISSCSQIYDLPSNNSDVTDEYEFSEFDEYLLSLPSNAYLPPPENIESEDTLKDGDVQVYESIFDISLRGCKKIESNPEHVECLRRVFRGKVGKDIISV